MRIPDLATLYETKTDEELLQLAADSAQLMPEAHTALASELTKRRIDVGKHSNVRGYIVQERIEQTSSRQALSLNDSHGVAAFVAEVLRIYHDQFWLFVWLIGPAVVVGWIAVFAGRHEGREIASHLPRGIELFEHKTEILEISFVNLAGWFVSWIAFSLSFGAICSVVRQIEGGAIPSIPDALVELRQCVGSFLRLSLLLFALCLVAFGASMALSTIILWLSFQRYIHISGFSLFILSFGLTGLALLVLSRFALAVPAVVLDHYGVTGGMFRSDELTQGKWLTLAALLAKSLIGGYMAGMCPFWLASLLLTSIPLPYWFPWVLTVTSIAAVTVVEPTMFIGFVLLYLRMSALLPAASTEALATQLA